MAPDSKTWFSLVHETWYDIVCDEHFCGCTHELWYAPQKNFDLRQNVLTTKCYSGVIVRQ